MNPTIILAYLWLLNPIINLFKWKQMAGIRYRIWIALMTHAYGVGEKIRGPHGTA